ncbi:MAG: RNA polymerase sigma factor [Cytophagales bacterium]|nr:MAG: RNA polymerase sigma factor [Cytophagales bacterium]
MNEQDLVLGLKKGDQSIFKQIISLYKNKVYNTLLNLLQNVEDAQDLSQEVFVEVFLSVGKFEGRSSLSTWIYRITVSKGLDYMRRKKRKKRFGVIYSLFKPESTEPAFEQATFNHPALLLENEEQATILLKAIYQLPEKQKIAFILSKLEELSYQEISQVMETSISSVESLLFRAKQNLQKILADYYTKNYS